MSQYKLFLLDTLNPKVYLGLLEAAFEHIVLVFPHNLTTPCDSFDGGDGELVNHALFWLKVEHKVGLLLLTRDLYIIMPLLSSK